MKHWISPMCPDCYKTDNQEVYLSVSPTIVTCKHCGHIYKVWVEVKTQGMPQGDKK